MIRIWRQWRQRERRFCFCLHIRISNPNPNLTTHHLVVSFFSAGQPPNLNSNPISNLRISMSRLIIIITSSSPPSSNYWPHTSHHNQEPNPPRSCTNGRTQHHPLRSVRIHPNWISTYIDTKKERGQVMCLFCVTQRSFAFLQMPRIRASDISLLPLPLPL